MVLSSWSPRGRWPCTRQSRCRGRGPGPRWRSAGWLRGRDLVARQKDDRLDAGGGAVSRQAAEVSPVEAQAMARTPEPAAMICCTTLTSTVMPRSLNEPVWLLPDILTHNAQAEFVPEAFGPGRGWCALVHRHDVVGGDLRRDPLLLAPHAAAAGHSAVCMRSLKRAFHSTARSLERVHVMAHFQQPVAVRAAIDDVKAWATPLTAAHTLEPGLLTRHDLLSLAKTL